MIGAIAIVLVLAGLIFFHELGHFLVARAFGIGVETFSIGFGKALISWKRKKTTYQISLVPLGGYVAIVGEDKQSDLPEGFTREESFSLRSPFQRLAVVLAGPVFNIVLAFLIYWGLCMGGNSYVAPHISNVLPGPAAEAGILAGDTVHSIDGTRTLVWDDVLMGVNMSRGKEIEVTVMRDGKPHKFDITPAAREETGRDGKTFTVWVIGIQASGERLKLGPIEAIESGLYLTAANSTMIVKIVGKLFTGDVPVSELGGPVMIASAVHSQATYGGLIPLLKFTAMLSINLGLLNLLPIPALDGGHVLFNLIEIVFRRPVPARFQHVVTYAGFMLLLGLMVLATGFDILRLFS